MENNCGKKIQKKNQKKIKKKKQIKSAVVSFISQNKDKEHEKFVAKTNNIYKKDPKTRLPRLMLFKHEKDFNRDRIYHLKCNKSLCKRQDLHPYDKIFIFGLFGKKFYLFLSGHFSRIFCFSFFQESAGDAEKYVEASKAKRPRMPKRMESESSSLAEQSSARSFTIKVHFYLLLLLTWL